MAALHGHRVRTQRLREQAAQALERSVLDAREAALGERVRIAREVHDIVGHHLSAIRVQAAAAHAVPDPDRAQQAFGDIAELASTALTQTREVLGRTRDGTAEGTKPPGPPTGLADLPALLEAVRATGTQVALTVIGAPRPYPPAVEDAAHRIVQESLTNVLRHAVPRRAAVEVRHDDGALRLVVHDEGRGSGTVGHGWGLRGMTERAALLGGSVVAGQRVNGSTGRRGDRLAGRGPPPCPGAPGRPMTMVLRVLVADDQPLVRSGYRTVLDAADGVTVVGEAADGGQAVALAARLRPDVVVMDVRMPRVDGLTATGLLSAQPGGPAVLVVTTYDLDEYVFGALRAGAAGFLLKDAEPADLVAAVRTVASGDGVVAPGATRRLIAEFARLQPRPATDPRLSLLTPREAEVLRHVARGGSNTAIARALSIDESTVKTHVTRMLTKLDIRSRAQAVVFAYDNGVVTPTGSSQAAPAPLTAR